MWVGKDGIIALDGEGSEAANPSAAMVPGTVKLLSKTTSPVLGFRNSEET